MAQEPKKPKSKDKRAGDEDTFRSRLHDFFYGFSYTTRVTVTFALVAMMTAVVAMGVLSYVWEEHFQTYTRENVEQLASTTASSIAKRYESNNSAALSTSTPGAYPAMSVDDVQPAESAHTLQPGMGIQVVTASSGTIIYDSSRTNPTSAGSTDLTAGASFAPSNDDDMALSQITLSDGHVIGEVRMWVYGSDLLLSKADQEFRVQSYQGMAFAALISIALACFIGLLFARGLVRPINRITKTAQIIKEGDLSARVGLEGNDEIAEMGKTFDAMAESVESNQQLERRLTTDVAHELRTPLMAIQSTVEAIIDGVFEADEERLNTIDSEVQRLSRLVDAILKLSRLENRSTPMDEQVLDLGELIRPAVMNHEALINDAGLALEYNAEPGIMIYGDADKLSQATANLISNAVRYTPAPGKITVSVTSGDVMASIAVRDTGIGLTPEERRMVFKRFWRSDESRQRASGGLGVGLAVVKEIVDRHGGWVEVEGKKGEGSCFTIHVPLYDVENQEKVDPSNHGLKPQVPKWKGRK